jgi:hypothetical protein
VSGRKKRGEKACSKKKKMLKRLDANGGVSFSVNLDSPRTKKSKAKKTAPAKKAPPPPPPATNALKKVGNTAATLPGGLPLKKNALTAKTSKGKGQRARKAPKKRVSPKKQEQACERLHQNAELKGELKGIYEEGRASAELSKDSARDHELWLLSRRVKAKQSLSISEKEKERIAKSLALFSNSNQKDGGERHIDQYAASSVILNLVDRLLPSIEEDASSGEVTSRLEKALLGKPNKNLRNQRQNGKLLLFGSALSMWSLSTAIGSNDPDDDSKLKALVLRDLDYCLVLPDAEEITATQRKRLVFVIKNALERAGFLECMAIHRARVPVRTQIWQSRRTVRTNGLIYGLSHRSLRQSTP